MSSSIYILGIRIDLVSIEDIHTFIKNQIKDQKKSIILNVNIHAMNLVIKYPWLKTYINKADMVFTDGAGIILGAKILGYSIPERITYADWMWNLAKYADINGFSLFFLGAKPGIAEKAIQKIKGRFPNIMIDGALNGYFDKTKGNPENNRVIQTINKVRPDILIVGFGMPAQEQWLMENWDEIDAKIALTGGAVFDYISGSLPRAPMWMTNHGLEWLGRLLIEPRRLWKRYILGIPVFFFRVFKELIINKLRK